MAGSNSRTRNRTRNTVVKRETLSGTTFQLRPDYDDVVDTLGEPPTGVPEEAQFHWPAIVPEGMVIEPGKFIYVTDISRCREILMV